MRRCTRPRGKEGRGFWSTRRYLGGLVCRRYPLEARRHGGEGPPDRGRGASRAFTFAHVYAAPQHLVLTRMPRARRTVGSPARQARTMQDRATELRRIHLPRTTVNKGKRKGRSVVPRPSV